MNRCPYCGRKTYYQGLYCGICARLIWKPEFVLIFAAGAILFLGFLIWTIDRLATASSY